MVVRGLLIDGMYCNLSDGDGPYFEISLDLRVASVGEIVLRAGNRKGCADPLHDESLLQLYVSGFRSSPCPRQQNATPPTPARSLASCQSTPVLWPAKTQ